MQGAFFYTIKDLNPLFTFTMVHHAMILPTFTIWLLLKEHIYFFYTMPSIKFESCSICGHN